MKRTIEDALDEAVSRVLSDDFVRAIITGARKSKKPEYLRVDLRPVKIKDEIKIQVIAHDGKKDFTRNISLDVNEVLTLLRSGYANVIVESTTESYQVQITKKDEAITGISKVKLERRLDHDIKKERLLAEDHPIFEALGMSDTFGRIKPSWRDKYIQIDQLLRILEPTLSRFRDRENVKVVDLASGSAALTMAVHSYLSRLFSVQTIGVEQVVALATKAAQTALRAGTMGIEFRSESISDSAISHTDIVLALHACDTATDDALSFVLKVRPEVALVVPCCHKSHPKEVIAIAREIKIFGRDGIVDERLLDLVWDEERAGRLRDAGYSVDIIEFVGDEHTARNLLIRAVR